MNLRFHACELPSLTHYLRKEFITFRHINVKVVTPFTGFPDYAQESLTLNRFIASQAVGSPPPWSRSRSEGRTWMTRRAITAAMAVKIAAMMKAAETPAVRISSA